VALATLIFRKERGFLRRVKETEKEPAHEAGAKKKKEAKRQKRNSLNAVGGRGALETGTATDRKVGLPETPKRGRIPIIGPWGIGDRFGANPAGHSRKGAASVSKRGVRNPKHYRGKEREHTNPEEENHGRRL